jgi:hypothetical protein
VGVIKAPWPIVHVHRYIDDTQTDPDTGNSPLVEDPPVIRHVISFTQVGFHGSSHLVMDEGFEDRVNTTWRMATLEPDKYTTHDHVFRDFRLDPDGVYIPGSGVAYWVDGTPTDSRIGPWPKLLKQFGGVVHIRRVT